MSGDDDLEQLLDRLEGVSEAIDGLEDDLGDLEEDTAEEIEEAYVTASSILDTYEERATGSGDFPGFVEFRQTFEGFVRDLPEELPYRDVFEEAQECVNRRRLSERHFEDARDALEPAEDVVETMRALRDRRDTLHDVRHALAKRRDALLERRDHLDELSTFDPETLDVDTTALRDAVEAFNEGVRDDFSAFLRSASIRRVLEVHNRMEAFPLVESPPVPADLLSYVQSHAIGEEPVATIREYLGYSRSKLDHYLEDPGHFLAEVRPHNQYLEELTADPFCIRWPPRPARELRWALDELRRAIEPFASEATIDRLRSLRETTQDEQWFRERRHAAIVRHELNEQERTLVRTGQVDDELTSVTERLERIEDALAAAPNG